MREGSKSLGMGLSLAIESVHFTQLCVMVSFSRFPCWDPALPPSQSILPVEVEVTETGLCHGVVIWWSLDFEGTELNMDPWHYRQVCT